MRIFKVVRESNYNSILVGEFDNGEEARKLCDRMNAAIQIDKSSDIKYSCYEYVLPHPIDWITYEVTFFDGLRDPDPVIKIFNRDGQFHTGDVIIHTVSRNIIVCFSIIINSSEITREKVIALARRVILRK